MKNVSKLLKARVEHHCNEFNEKSPLLKLGRAGGVTHFHAAAYVINLEHLFFQNCNEILEGSKKYATNKVVGDFYFHKWNEEKGHDAWARADWVKMSKTKTFERMPTVIPEMYELTSFLSQTMRECPYKYITYMFVAEYMTPILGPIWLQILNENLGIKANEVTALSKHIDLDVGHAMEVGEFLDSLNLSENIKESIVSFVDDLFIKYNDFFSALAGLNGRVIESKSTFRADLAST